MKTVNFQIVQGDTFVLTATYKDNAGNPINLGGYTATFQVKDQPGGNTLCATATVGDGIVIDAPNGLITVTLSPAKTKKFTVPKAAHQLQIDSGSIKTTIITGWFAVEKGVI
jgi:hypothetical protein